MRGPKQLSLFPSAEPGVSHCPRCGGVKQRNHILCGKCYCDTPVELRREASSEDIITRRAAIKRMISRL
jgi:ribosomal protein L32